MPNLYPFLAYVFVTTFTPGPNNIMSMTNGLRYGYPRTLKFLAGIATGFMLVMLATAALNALLVSLVPTARPWLNLLGAAYMFYLALHIVLHKPVDEKPGRSNLNTFGAGLAMQFVNVKVILYGITVFALFITPAFASPLSAVLFAILLAGVSFASTTTWALGGSLLRGLIRKYERWFNLAMAALLIYTAVVSLLTSHIL
jgi:cysteine/O-acetylserine efflux protein